MKSNTLGIYVHIPFCVKKCAYCDFLSAPPAGAYDMTDYVKALCREAELKGRLYGRDALGGKAYGSVNTVFFGGGTPSLLPTEEIERIMLCLRECFDIDRDAEITLECNPETADYGKLLHYRNLGINRISFGLQSASDKELRAIGRIHSYSRFLESYAAARQAGFDNINVDLISALPGQTVSEWEDTLTKTAELSPEHISAYSLILEEGTRLFEEKESLVFPTEDEDALMYEMTEKILGRYGYHRYEISNYARQGCESRHNNRYWRREDYIGIGVGAASCIDGRRFSNVSDSDIYKTALLESSDTPENILGRITGEDEILSADERMSEFFFLGLRRMEGIYFKDFEEEFNVPPQELYGSVLEKLTAEGLLEYIVDNNRQTGVRLTGKGIFVSNRVFVEFVR